MNAHSLRWAGIAACLLFLGAALSDAREPAVFYYLAVPVAHERLVCIASVQLDNQGRLLGAPRQRARFFTIWRSGYWAEKTPDVLVKTPGEWNKVLELRAQKAVAAKKEMGGLPAPIVDFFVAVETLRAAALNEPPVLQPLFPAGGFIGWQDGAHLDVLAVPDTQGPKERAKALLCTMGASQKEAEQDPGQWMKSLLGSLGVKVQSVRYWPEYNVFLFEAGADFKETVDVLFNATAMERSRLPGAPVCVMLPKL